MSQRHELSVEMRREWERRAHGDSYRYIASWKHEWETGAFLESGEQDYLALVNPALSRLGLEPDGKSVLEVGCGAGRMTGSFARRFERVYALDVSTEMVRQGRELTADPPNVAWLVGDGLDLAMFRTGSLDFVFSYNVIHHLPAKDVSLRYIQEMVRVLKRGAAFHFHFNSELQPSMNWRGRLLWSVLDRCPNAGARAGIIRIANWLQPGSVDGLMAGRTWRGKSLSVRETLEELWRAGARVSGVNGWGSKFSWVSGVKDTRASG